MLKNIILFLLLPVLSSCVSFSSHEEKEIAFKDFKINKPFCLGRMLILLPEDAEILHQSYEFNWKLNEQKKQTKEEFMGEVNKLKVQLKNISHDEEKLSLVEEIILKNGDRILLSWEKLFGTEMYTINAFGWRNGITFAFKVDAIGIKELQYFKQKFQSFLLNLQYRSQMDIPNKPGFCFENGFIADNEKEFQNETSSIEFTIKSHPDLLFSIYTSPKSNSDEELDEYFKRMSGIPNSIPEIFYNPVKILHEGKYNSPYFKGEEMISSHPLYDENKNRYQKLDWNNIVNLDNNLKPGVSVHMSTANHQISDYRYSIIDKTSFSDQEAIQFFHEIIGNIQPRPNKNIER